MIAVMGITGSGKSSLIRHLNPDRDVVVGDNMFAGKCSPRSKAHILTQLETQQVGMFLCRHPRFGRIWLIDTPGFSDTLRSDAEILEELAAWLRKAYLHDVRLTGIVYLHSIMQRRISNSSARALSLFKDLTGEDALDRVFLVTTFWDLIRQEQWQEAERREQELHQDRRYWGRFIDRGAHTRRHDNTESSADGLIKAIIDNVPHGDAGIHVQLQEELQHGIRLDETSVGLNVADALKRQEAAWEAELADLRRELQSALDRQRQEHKERLAETEQRYQQWREQMQRDEARLQADSAAIDERLRALETAERRRLEEEQAAESARRERLEQRNGDLDRDETRPRRPKTRKEREEELWYPRCVHM